MHHHLAIHAYVELTLPGEVHYYLVALCELSSVPVCGKDLLTCHAQTNPTRNGTHLDILVTD